MDTYFLLSNDPQQKLFKRKIEKNVKESVSSLIDYVQKEFKLEEYNIDAIGTWDDLVKDYVVIEKGEECKESIRFKVYTSLKSIVNFRPTKKYPKEQQQLREELAAAYRLFDMFGWGDLIYNHLTVAINENEKEERREFLINPFGLLFSEITASSLVTVDLEGNITDKGSTKFDINRAGYVIHSAIHRARKDIKCVMHCHSTAGVAVACLKDGFQYVCQNSAIVGPVSYHDYEGLAVNLEEQERLVKDLGPTNKVAALSCGGKENIIIPDSKIQNFTEKTAANFNPEGVGQKEFAALLRKLDKLDPSYKL